MRLCVLRCIVADSGGSCHTGSSYGRTRSFGRNGTTLGGLLLLQTALLLHHGGYGFLTDKLGILVIEVSTVTIAFTVLIAQVLVQLHDFVGTGAPLARTEDLLQVGWINHFFLDEHLGQLLQATGVLHQNALGTVVLPLYQRLHLFVDHLSRALAVGLGERVLCEVIIIDVGHLLAHAINRYHAVDHIGHALQVVACTGADMAGE